MSQAAHRALASPSLICFSHLRWHSVFQRPQQLLTRAARGYDVVFFEEPVFAEGDAHLALETTPEGVVVATPVLPHGVDELGADAAQRALLDGLVAERGGDIAVAWFYTPVALGFAGHLKPRVLVYDCMDELAAFRFASPRLVLLERHLLKRADLVFTGGRSLYESKSAHRSDVHCFPSSVDAAHFRRAATVQEEPADQRALPRPRLGFFGVIDERMDLGLLDEIAALRPGWQIVMLGPTAKIDPASLPRRPNLHWLGQKAYAELPAYLAGWDVGLMPFARNEATRYISPTKTPEFLAAGVPLVSTPIADVVREWGSGGLVEIAEDAAGFVARAEALLDRPRGPWLSVVNQRLARMSWDATWQEMDALIRRCMGRPEKSAAHV
jgi:glycosyltransferase involved in cell wall biosynthesis